MDRCAHVLYSRVAQHGHLARLGIDVHVGDVRARRAAPFCDVDVANARDRPTRPGQLRGKLVKGHAGCCVRARGEPVPVERHRLDRHGPERGGPLGHLCDHVPGCLDDGYAGGHGCPAAGTDLCKAGGAGVARAGLDLIERQSQHLCRLHCQAGARARDVDRPGEQAHGAISIDADRAARLCAPVAPVGKGDTPSAVGSREGSAIVRVFLRSLEHLRATDIGVHRTGDAACALSGTVLAAEGKRVHADLFRQFVDHCLAGKGGRGSARCAVGLHLGPVDQYVIAIDLSVGDVIGGKDHPCARADGRAGIRAGLVPQRGLGCGDLAVARRSHFHLDHGAGRGPGGQEHLGTRHDDLDRAACLARQHRRRDRDVGGVLAAERTAHLCGHDADL